MENKFQQNIQSKVYINEKSNELSVPHFPLFGFALIKIVMQDLDVFQK